MEHLLTDKYRYERQGADSAEWVEMRTPDEKEYMLRMLGNAYVNVSMILDAMHKGLPGRTPFATFRAIPIDAESA